MSKLETNNDPLSLIGNTTVNWMVVLLVSKLMLWRASLLPFNMFEARYPMGIVSHRRRNLSRIGVQIDQSGHNEFENRR